MFNVSRKLLAVVGVSILLSSAGLAHAQKMVVADNGAETSADTILAALPVAPSLAFFVGGIAGLAFLARRKRRKASPLY